MLSTPVKSNEKHAPANDKVYRRNPVLSALKLVKEEVRKIPPRYRWFFIFACLGWKVVLGLGLLYLASTGAGFSTHASPEEQTQEARVARVLYIVTSLAEYNTGKRNTIKNQDRLKEVLLPVLSDSVSSIVKHGNIAVDVFLITAFEMKPEREDLIRAHLPSEVGLQVWDDACPLGYDPPLRENKKEKEHRLSENTRALARQHRYVIRDKFEYYDLFVAVEDDMRITGDHLRHFIDASNALEDLRLKAPIDPEQNADVWKSELSRRQLDRMIPGFVRVEVLLDPEEHGAQTELDPIDLDFKFDSGECHFDPTICCHMHLPNDLIPQEAPLPPTPSRDDVVVWETNIRAMAVKKLGHDVLDWVALLPGPGKKMKDIDRVFGFWSGAEGAFGADAEKPSPGEPALIAQQGGWIATREQIHRMQDLCMGSFLPPFDEPAYRSDGQESMNVEFWSGGYQFFTGVKGGCNMQRVVSLKPEHFSKHFIYHAANNKQRQLSQKRMLKADNLMGQLNSVKKAAELALTSR